MGPEEHADKISARSEDTSVIRPTLLPTIRKNRVWSISKIIVRGGVLKRHFLDLSFRHITTNTSQKKTLPRSNKFLKEYRPEKLWAYLGVFGQIIREGQAQGLFREDIDPFITSWAFFGAMDELAMQWVLTRNQSRFPLEATSQQVAEIFIRGLLAPGQTIDSLEGM